MDELNLGKIAFEAYGKFTEGKTYNGKTIPPWTELKENIQGAWQAAAQAVVDASTPPDDEIREDTGK